MKFFFFKQLIELKILYVTTEKKEKKKPKKLVIKHVREIKKQDHLIACA
jgi:hypothetical protein